MHKEPQEITLVVDPELPANVGSLISNGFGEFFSQAASARELALSINVVDGSDREGMAKARRVRLDIRAIRTGAEKRRKEMKADSLRLGKAIDGAYNILEAALVPLEERLQLQETTAERMEAERIAALRAARIAELSDIQWTPPAGDIGAMSDQDWLSFVIDARDLHALRQERARKEEEERLVREAEERRRREEEARKIAEERARIEAENARLRAERAKMEAERAEAERLARIERERIEAERRKEREAAEAAAKAERDARAKAEAEAQALRDAAAKAEREKAEAEAKAAADAEAARRKAERAPDKAKLIEFAARLRTISPVNCTSPLGISIEDGALAALATLADQIAAKAAAL